MLTALGLLAVVALILANGYFVAAEFAFVAAKRVRLEERAQAGDAKAHRAVAVHKELSFMLSGAQLGITVTSLVVGYIAEPTLGRAIAPVLGSLGVPESARFGIALTLGFLLATIAQMVLGELAPKNLAIAKPEAFARALARSVWVYTRVASPLIRLFDGSANRLLRAFGIEPIAELAGGVSAEELDRIVEESAKTGSLSDAQASLLGRALEFRDLRAVDAMVPRVRVVTIPVTATGADLRRLLTSSHTRFPVTGTGSDPSDVVGVVHAKDLLALPAASRATTAVADLLRPVLAVPETAPLHTVLGELRRSHTELAIVVDEYGGAAGIVTLEDLVEELVGDISDEHDVEEATVELTGEQRWRIPGSWRLDEIERDTGIDLPDGDYDTVAGLVLERLGRIPEAGDAVEVDGTRIEVEAMEGWAVTCVLVSPAEPVEAEATDADSGAMSTPLALAVALVLLAANAFFVAAEFALLAARRTRIEALAEGGDRRARHALAGIRELSLMLAGAQLGITMASLGLGAVAEPAVASLLESALSEVDLPDGARHAIAFGLALSIVVFLHMVVGEMAPKSWAISHPESSALSLARPFRAFALVLRPFIRLLNGISNVVVRLCGVQPQDELALAHSPADLLLLLNESVGQGTLEADQHDLLARSLELSGLDALAAMTPRREIVSVHADAGVEEIERVASESGRSRILVYEGDLDHAPGVVHAKDLLLLDDGARADTTARSLLRPVLVTHESHALEDLLLDMRQQRLHLAVVVDELGTVAGLVTMEDVLEELIGDFEDESDRSTRRLRRLPGGAWAAAGTLRPDELAERTGVVLPEGPWDTVAGWVIATLDRIPGIGEVAELDGHTVEVVAMDGFGIEEVVIRPVRRRSTPGDPASRSEATSG